MARMMKGRRRRRALPRSLPADVGLQRRRPQLQRSLLVWVCVFICVYVYMCVYIHIIYIYIAPKKPADMGVCVYMYVCIYVCVCIYSYARID
jgi:hypothetical protein